MNRLGFRGRHAVVTSGATAMGYGIAQSLIAGGGRVTLWDRDEAAARQAAQSLGPQAVVVGVDVAQQASVVKAVEATVARLGAVDALVNSAGIAGLKSKLWNYPVDAWRELTDVNLTGAFMCCREMVLHMRERGYGRIVNVVSIATKDGHADVGAHGVARAATIALTRSLGKELADTGIRVNCVTPAVPKSALFDPLTLENIAAMLSKIPMSRAGAIEEVASLVSWLCTEECAFSAGAAFDLSGDHPSY